MLRSRPATETPWHDALDPQTVYRLAGDYYERGFDCAETLARVFSDLNVITETDANTLQRAARGLGNGLGGTRGNCGALTGAVIILNLALGPQTQTTKKMYRLVGAFTKRFEKHFKHLTCRNLLRECPMSCREKTCEAAVLLAAFLREKGSAL